MNQRLPFAEIMATASVLIAGIAKLVNSSDKYASSYHDIGHTFKSSVTVINHVVNVNVLMLFR